MGVNKKKFKWHILLLLLLLVNLFTGCSFVSEVYMQVAFKTFCDYGNTSSKVLVRIHNNSKEILSSDKGYMLTYRLFDKNYNDIEFEDIRTPLPTINPGETKDVSLQIKTPINAGKYIIDVDIFQEGVGFLSAKGNKTAQGILIVENDGLKEYGANISVNQEQINLDLGERKSVPVVIKNTGSLIWDNEKNIFLAYHIYNEDGSIYLWDSHRTSFGTVLRTGDELNMSLVIDGTVFEKTGNYQLEIDLVHEGVCWFSEKGVKTIKVPLKVY